MLEGRVRHLSIAAALWDTGATSAELPRLPPSSHGVQTLRSHRSCFVFGRETRHLPPWQAGVPFGSAMAGDWP